MTERLSALLHDEADALDIPPVDQDTILGSRPLAAGPATG